MKLFFLLFFLILISQTSFAESPTRVTCLTSKCHTGMSETKFLHSPIQANGCVVCHQLLGPLEKNKKLPTAHPNIALDMGKNQAILCLKCHVEWGKSFNEKAHPHSAISKFGCTSCHNPHGADNKKLLKKTEFKQELCLSCHKKDDNWEKGKKENIHRAINVENKCLNCHEIHASNKPKLLKAEPAVLCIGCHKYTTEIKANGSLHTPVKKGECLKCHSPHFGVYKNLLDKNYQADTYVPNAAESFQLCFSCHDPMKTTKFRNGEKNLHDLHVLNKAKGSDRGCSTCHSVHGANQEMQIANSFSYKTLSLPIIFIKQTNGGNCTTACHGLKNYDRINPVTNKEGR